MIAVEKNVPMPTAGPRNAAKYPWAELEVGDSFLMPKPLANASAQASIYGTRKNKKFACRAVEGGTRIWRVA